MTPAIGGIDRDTLRYHGSYPFSDWGAVWKRTLVDVPPDATYALYDQCVRATGVLPVPPLMFFQSWENKNFRILKQEGENVVALYRDDGKFLLIQAKDTAYRAWTTKKNRDPDQPPFAFNL
ncbi:MAG: hypothetical protein H0U59_12925 [Gemmatimonadaceae bacterium]|nr:hypothetical protein [Gemmatimonadaceae bacterium]